MSKKKLISKHTTGGGGVPRISVTPITFREDTKLIPESVRNWFKKTAKSINTFANKEYKIPTNINIVNNVAMNYWTAGQRYGDTYEEHFNKVNEQLQEAGIGIKDTTIKPKQVASAISLVSAGLSKASPLLGFGLSAPDIVFDWAASIDEPSVINHVSTGLNHGETLTKVLTPSFKYDDYVVKFLRTAGNASDAAGIVD